jgi:hypothetical protein
MLDGSLWTAVISASGAVLGVAATLWGTARRDAQQAARQREQLLLESRQRAYAELMGPAMQLRVQIEMACARMSYDMDAKLAAVQENVEKVGLHASHVAVIAPTPVADAARSLAAAATTLSSTVVRGADMTYDRGPEVRFIVGEIRVSPDFREFDTRIDGVYQAIEADIGNGHLGGRRSLGFRLRRKRALPR